MSLRSAAARVLGHFGGRSTSQAKIDAALENLPERKYNLSTPSGLLDSLDDEDRAALENVWKGVRQLAQPFNGGNTNWLGWPAEVQYVMARKKVRSLGLPEEVEDRSLQFANQFIREGMGDRPSAIVPQENLHAPRT
jgi:hypothetical protein